MSSLCQLVFSLLTSMFLQRPQNEYLPQSDVFHSFIAPKLVAIVGAGSAGLAMLKTLLDLPLETRKDWDIVLYEQRRDVGGMWLPDLSPAVPPNLPETPLYPLLHTISPVPTMTYPGFPFPPGTPLLTLHEDVECYHRDYATRYGLWSHIKLNHTVMLSTWVGTQHAGHWDVTINDNNGDEIRRSFDHLVVASGHNLAPHIPVFPGQNAWLENTSKEGRRHEILHSLWYREPTRYTNQTVVVVGGGGGGIDIASQLTLHARKVYHAIRTLKFPTTVPVEIKLQIAYFTPDEIVFADGTSVRDVDSVVLGTGYDLRIPFLERGGELIVKPGSNQTDGSLKLITNLRYMFPLHRHIFSLSPSYPTNALAFIGLNELVPHAPADIAQSIYVTCVILNGSLLAPRKELLRQLAADEEDLMQRGYDPYYIGHRMADNSGFDYQDDLINTLRMKGALPESDDNFVEAWRREAGEYEFCVKQGWRRIEELGDEDEWMKGIETEEEWADLMRRINAWQRDWEMEHGLVFPADDIYTIEY